MRFQVTLLALLYIHLLTKSNAFQESCTLNNTANNALVVFDPYVSILDTENRFRYNLSDLGFLVEKVATCFTRFFIQLSEADIIQKEKETSLFLSPLAVANRNSQSGRTKKLEVWLAYRVDITDYDYNDNSVYHNDPIRILERLNSLAKKANDLYNDTVTTILLPYKLLYNQKSFADNIIKNKSSIASFLPGVKKWGLLMDTDIFLSNFNCNQRISQLNPDVGVVVLIAPNRKNNLLKNFDFPEEIQQRCLRPLQSLGFLFGAPDTENDGEVNTTFLVTSWNAAISWAEENRTTLILSKAFDTPHGQTIHQKTSGWWRLVENSSYNSTSEYLFEEKVCLAKKEKLTQKTISLSKLQHKINFRRDHVGIIFSLYDIRRDVKRLPEVAVNILVKNVAAQFSKVVILLHEDSKNELRSLSYELQIVSTFQIQVEVLMVVLPGVKPSNMFTGSPMDLNTTLSKFLIPVKSFVFPFEGNRTNETEKFIKEILNHSKIIGRNFGYALNTSICSSFLILDSEQRKLLHLYLSNNETKTIIFYFEESEETVKLGAIRMFQQRTVVLEKCSRFLIEQNLTQVKPTFMMLHYGASSLQRKSDFVNFIEYWQMLIDWAKNQNSTIILSNVVDAQRHFRTKQVTLPELGWWRYREGFSKMWVSKIEEALERFPEPTETTNLQFHLIIGGFIITFGAAFIVLIALFMIRRHYRESYLTRVEINEFFNGNEEADMFQNAPYDKSRYEIDGNSFTINEDSVLGSGVFGKVCFGEVKRNGEIIKAAIKMVNPINIHKTTISGFLSEIKVLSHVGKHENIIELIGANTQELKLGKVFIFLELCEIGSLEKHLHLMRLSIDSGYDGTQTERYTNPMRSTLDFRVEKYLDMLTMNKNSLNFLLSQDCYRWSQEICSGMAYLASKHVVHADLATRNVLLNVNKVAKICDFGLSRRMYNYTNYVKQQQEPLPWKWMAPESLRLFQFNEKSDVWAYGITLWEIYTLGDTPYPGLAWSLSFPDMLEGGLRLRQPQYDDKNLYLIMRECWQTKPEYRPSFADIQTKLNL